MKKQVSSTILTALSMSLMTDSAMGDYLETGSMLGKCRYVIDETPTGDHSPSTPIKTKKRQSKSKKKLARQQANTKRPKYRKLNKGK